jgi:hypothetical protein
MGTSTAPVARLAQIAGQFQGRRIAPIGYTRPFPEIPVSDISDMVDEVRCTRGVAAALIHAARGNVEAACEAWRQGHGEAGEKAAYARFLGSLEASE